jgi:hypothetical protein
LPEPAHQLGLHRPTEFGKVAVGFQKRVLDQVRGIDLALQPSPDL